MSISKLDQESLWQEFTALPEDAQVEVTDFIAFLRARYRRARSRKTAKSDNILNDSVRGMWQNREDMVDSVAWVRSIRESEWSKNRG